MSNTAFVIEKVYNASAAKVWKAITDVKDMRQWYFDVAEFKAEVGFEFTFTAGPDDKLYTHICKVTEVIPGKKLTYTWRYEGYEGDSAVSFELFPEGDKTRLKLTHTGLETFPSAKDPNLAKESFASGWTDILGNLLKNFLEKEEGTP